jgi:RHS repeat-associated protein
MKTRLVLFHWLRWIGRERFILDCDADQRIASRAGKGRFPWSSEWSIIGSHSHSSGGQPCGFSSASFSGTSGTLTGGVTATSNPGTVYSYTITGSSGPSGYAANGNLSTYNDLMDGGWTLNYDHVNRVTSAVATSGVWNNLTLAWNYDSFGNRKMQTPSGENVTAPVPQPQTLNYPSQNRISNYGAGGYDGAGNVKYDLINNYLYDPEGRLCAVEYPSGTTTAYMLYVYDGEGRRVAKVSNPTFSCTPASSGSVLQETYLLGPSGEHITELGQAGIFIRSNVYANGQLLATYANNKTYFALNDWLGTKRVVANDDGTVAQMCMNLPFGDELMCSATDLSEQHFTGQIHDQESGNDYFNARYYSNSTGRFLSPDPSGLDYADPSNPQSLNLYAYVNNNPLVSLDPNGLALQISCNSVPSSYTDDGSGGLIVTGYSDSCTYTDDGQDGLNQPSFSFQKQSTPHPLNLPARHFVAPNKTGCSAGSFGTAVSKIVGSNALINASYTTSGPGIALGALVGSAFGPVGAFAGGILGSQLGVGGSLSYVPSTGSLYVGVVATAGAGYNGGGGISVSSTSVPNSQNPNAIANGQSYSVTFLPWGGVFGSTVSKSPGSGPPVVGFAAGTRSPVSGSAGYSICITHCGC